MSEVLRCSVFSEVYRGEIEYRAEKAIILNMTLLMIIACCLVVDSEAVWSYNIFPPREGAHPGGCYDVYTGEEIVCESSYGNVAQEVWVSPHNSDKNAGLR